ncbi:glycoside hydrolase family 28 protein [Streptomyces sp. MP131-18]|uniref:glycoside hydrolase family 28 protein n=1 Tax=Streptomyces sp. MP131-18 TaxID=1857892 RepID=UPI0009D48200|nr:glycoside hydrolase family 28 protein [Streptomyces sp. MP131-18]ONK09641.1 Exo-poly-alpha-D-galacturonosidase precursor [Streptomyces sp. MP131-18]
MVSRNEGPERPDAATGPARRTFILGAGSTAALALGAGTGAAAGAPARRPSDAQAARIMAGIRPPRFPRRTVTVTDHGAVGDGTTDCTAAIASAIAACHAAGGGHVIVPEGTYLTGAVHLRDNIDLHLAAGATLRFSRDPAAYLPPVHTRYEGIECLNYSPFVYAHGCRNIALTGSGVIDGRADDTHWWDWTRGEDGGDSPESIDKRTLRAWAEEGVPVEQRIFGGGHHLRPNMIQFYDCRNVLIEGVTVKDSPMWNIHPVLCRNVTVRGVRVESPNGPNNDGCNPESCAYVLIKDCVFNTGDDCIAFKAGRDADGRRVNVPCHSALVEGCEMRDGHGGVTIGSEMTGGVHNILARDCRMDSPQLDRALRLKSNPNRGGHITDIVFTDITVGTVGDAVIEIALDYENIDTGDHYPDVHGISVHHLTAESGSLAWNLLGNDANPIRDVLLHDCAFAGIEEGYVTENVTGLVLREVTINGADAGDGGGA